MKREIDVRRMEMVEDAMVEVLRGKTLTERVEMIFAAHRLMRLRIEGHLRTMHPDWTDTQISEEVSRRISHGAD